MSEPQASPPTPPPQQPSAPPPSGGGDLDANQWAMFVHFSMFAGYITAGAGLILPIILWQLKKDEFPEVDVHGKIVVNWIISALIYGCISLALTLVLIGFLLLPLLGVLCVVFPIIGGIKANNGEVWEYPLSLKLIK